MKLAVIVAAILAVVVVVAATQFTLFVIQPIGALPEGRTLLIGRVTNTHFVDSADGICERVSGGVSLLCRVAVIGKVASPDNVYLRMPYSSTLYNISTGGKSYDR